MAEFTIPKHGTICWRELQTRDLSKAKEFYAELLGWKLEQSKLSPVEYPEIHVNNNAIGGMMELNDGFGEGWGTYIAVDDCEKSFEAVIANGGQTFCDPFDAPNVGRICIAADPSGAVFSMIEFLKEPVKDSL